MTTEILVRVVAPDFVAGLIMDGDRCIHAAPKLRWAIGKFRPELRAYFQRRGWSASIVGERRGAGTLHKNAIGTK